jgi:RNA polymerase sigma-70 factor (ECF subfamily)
MLQTTLSPVLKANDRQIFSDLQLLNLIACGEDWALSEIYDRYARLVFSIALKLLNDPGTAEEIVQQVFTQVWRHARQYRLERGTFSAWVGAITRHRCVDEFRRRRLQPVMEPADWESIDGLADNDNQAWETIEQDSIRAALQQIPSQQRRVIELAFWEGMTHQEIASYCHAPLGTVKTRLRLGKQRLKQLLQEPFQAAHGDTV